MGSRTSVDNEEKRKFLTLPGLELQPLSRPAQSQSLYRLHYTNLWSCEIRTIFISFVYVTSVATSLMKEAHFRNTVEMLTNYFILKTLMI
jgi:hypothetical protein